MSARATRTSMIGITNERDKAKEDQAECDCFGALQCSDTTSAEVLVARRRHWVIGGLAPVLRQALRRSSPREPSRRPNG
jgi:hypothetical protein